MDSKGFRVRGIPNLNAQPTAWFVQNETTREVNATKTTPAPDSRYWAYAAMMADGRLVTDYRQACVTRAPPGAQFATKQWTVHNADEIMRISRDRQMQNTGQALGTANTELPAALYQSCSPYGCQFTAGSDIGVGIERTDPAPPLFGTFAVQPDMETLANNSEHTALTTHFEYGRNTARRWARLYQE